MSKVFKKLAFLDPVANTVVSGSASGLVNPTASIKSEGEKAAAKEAAATAALGKGEAPGQAVAEKVKGEQFASRKDELRAAAGAAGATATASDIDLLGTPKDRVKKKEASKTLLGA